MKLKSIKISNILSFQHNTNINNCQELTFNTDLNILIGSNAAGKSNFLEIINKIFKSALVQSCQFQEQILQKHEKNPEISLNGTLSKRNVPHNLTKNYSSDANTTKEIKIKLELEDSDFLNLNFIIDNVIDINRLIGIYTTGISGFDNTVKEDDISNKKILEYTFIDENDAKIFSLNDNFNNESERFIFFYFNYFEFLQNIILLANRFENKNWPPLKMFSALISSYRNYSNISDRYSVEPLEANKWQQIYNKILEESTRAGSGAEPAIFELVKHRFAYALDKIELEMSQGSLSILENQTSLDILRESDDVFKGIEELLKSHLKLELDIKRLQHSRDYYFSFVDINSKKEIKVFDLSSGQKGLLHFIFSLYGYDMKNGIMVIDEPELHLHPQIQTKYLAIIEEIRSKLGIQFLLATHSPVFVNANTIDAVYRFYKKNGFTEVEKPTITESDNDLIHFLSYTNSSKIFFANKVILVEGYSDEYFFRYYLNNFKKRKHVDISDIEILNMYGKGDSKKWRDFLQKYKITTFFIGDLDNILEDYISIHALQWRRNYGKKLLRQQISQLTSTDYNLMLSEIRERYSDKIFLLSNGSLEDYLEPIIGKRPEFDDVIEFCKNDFDDWFTNHPNDSLANEVDYFLRYITI